MKHLFLSLLLFLQLTASEQIILVVSQDFNTSTAILQRYELKAERYQSVGDQVIVNLGRNGLGWGLGKTTIPHQADEPQKREGDGRAPAGIFALNTVFGYPSTVDTSMPYLQAKPDLICIDDSHSEHYNQILPIDSTLIIQSFEWMKREDELYALGVTVEHNQDQQPRQGSCIFLHIEKAKGSPTAGCTSMSEEDLKSIVQWIKPQKEPLLVQIPQEYCSKINKQFNGIKCP